MQEPATLHKPPHPSPLLRAGWLLLPIWLAVMFASSLGRDPVPLLVAQVMLLLPVTGALVCLIAVARTGPATLERRGWMLLAVATAFVWAGEVYYSGYQLIVDAAGPRTFGPYDGLNLAGAAVMIAGLSTAAGLGRVRKSDTFRLGADIIVLLVVVYVGLYHFWIRGLASGATPWWESARWTAYSLLGVLLLALVVLAYRNLRPIRIPRILMSLGMSLGIYSLGLILWPVWQSSEAGGGWASASVTCVVVLGYYLLFMSSLARLVDRDLSWRTSVSRLEMSGSVLPATVLSAIVFVAVWLTGLWAYEAPGSNPASVYVVAAIIATLALVARTGFASLEAGEWWHSSARDPVTGALNHRSFQELCEDRIAVAERGEQFAIALLDIDAFSRINRVLGHAEGDAVLRAVAEALVAECSPLDSVCRLSGDEFAVIAPGVGDSTALQFGRRVLSAVQHVEVSQMPGLSASVGVVTCADSCDREELLKRGDAAQTWAKYHGKNRAVVYDGHMVHALDVEERLRIRERESHLGIARALASAVDARDSSNYYHSRNVASLVALVCAELGFDEEHSRRVETAAILHDVGKIALSDEVLLAQRLSPRQLRLTREHVTLGETLVESLGEPGIPSWVRGHHERWDGSGYPDGLVGVRIPLEARIIALADAYDGMTSGQRTGKPTSKGAALQEIDHGIGSRFDPDLAEKFIHVVGMTSLLGWADDWSAA